MRHRRMLAPIKAIKHYFQIPAGVVTSGAISANDIVNVVAEGAARTNAFDVEEGAIVKAIFVEFWLSGVTADKTGTWALMKRPGNALNPTFTNMNNLGSYANKKNILLSGQGLMPTGGNIVPVIRQWVLIPKGKQRFGLGDHLTIVFAATGTNVNICGMVTFKEYN